MADTSGAQGLVLTNFSFRLAMLSQVDANGVAVVGGEKYTALYASIAEVALAGIPGVAISASGVELKLNQGKSGTAGAGAQTILTGFDFTEVTGLDPGATAFADMTPLQAFYDLSYKGTFLSVSAYGDPVGSGIELLVNLSGDTPTSADDADFAFSGDLSFEKTTSATGAVYSKISLTHITLTFGDYEFTGDALLYLMPQGMAGSFSVTLPDIAFDDGTNAYQIGNGTTATLEINTSIQAVYVEFANGDILDLPRGQFLRVEVENAAFYVDFNATDTDNDGTIDVGNAPEISLSGTLMFSQLTTGVAPNQTKRMTIAFTGVSGGYTDSNGDGFTIQDAKGVILIYSGSATLSQNGVAAQIEASAQGSAAGFSASASAIIRINTTSRTDIYEEVDVGDATYILD